MSDMEQLSVSLTPDLAAEVRAAVRNGDYGTVDDVVHAALRDWQLRRQDETLETSELRRLVQEGAESSPDLDGSEVFDKLRAKFGQASVA